MNFQDLKKSSNVDALTKQMEAQSKKVDYNDPRFITFERDKTGNGSAIIRFLPACEGESIPWVKIYNHSFKGPNGRWFIENCPTTMGYDHKCPVNQAA